MLRALTAAADHPESCRNIRYWGHYPIADIEYGLQTPVSVGLRAWAPFVPGDAETSNTPAIFFDVTLRNTSKAGQSGTIACCFPGPSETEAKSCVRSEFSASGVLAGGRVDWNGGSYVLVADAGAKIPNEGPQSRLRTAVDFDLGPGESKKFTFCLAWYLPRWAGSDAHHFRHAYAGRFSSVEQIVRSATRHHGAWPWYGVAVHVSGFWISALAMMERMAAAAGDSVTVDYSQKWRSTAQTSLETKLWNGNGYLLFRDSKTERQSDTILANQLAGQWCTRLHGLPGVFVQSHVAATLATIESTCMTPTENGDLNSLRPNGSRDHTAPPHSDGIFTGECLCLAAT